MITVYKNNNVDIRLDLEQLRYLEHSSIVEVLISMLYDNDFEIASEQYCVSNYDMAFDIYNRHNDKVYRIYSSYFDYLETGSMIKLRPCKYDKETMKMVYEYINRMEN